MPLLHVDDDPSATLIVGELLAGLGHEVIVASTVAEAWEILQDNPMPVLCDYRLPDGSGLDLFVRIRAADLDVHFVLFAGLVDQALLAKAAEAGVKHVVEKGIDLSSIEATMARLFPLTQPA